MVRFSVAMVCGLLVAGCGGTAQVTETAPEPTPEPTSTTEVEVPAEAAAPSDEAPPTPRVRGVGVCHAFGLPEGFDTQGATVRGAFPGELLGESLGPEMPFEAALRACVDEPTCTGITSDWYIGAPWFAKRGDAAFEENDDSYACTVTVTRAP